MIINTSQVFFGTYTGASGGGGGIPPESGVFYVNGKQGPSVTLTKTDIGLGNVNNTSDANKPISIAQQEEFDKCLKSVPLSGQTQVGGLYTYFDESTNRLFQGIRPITAEDLG